MAKKPPKKQAKKQQVEPRKKPAAARHRSATSRASAPPDGARGTPAAAEHQEITVVGIGGSTTDVDAIRALVTATPATPRFACVLVPRSADGADDPQRWDGQFARHVASFSPLQVVEVTGRMSVMPGHLYIGRPGAHISMVGGELDIDGVPADGEGADHGDGHGGHAGPLAPPIDHFFRSLARDQGPRAAAILLAGAGDDGSEGLEEIKLHRGHALAQDERVVAQGKTPRSAIEAELVDAVLPADKMLPYLTTLELRSTSTKRPDLEEELPEAFHQIFTLLRNRSRHDFSSYKRSTIRRRIERRMAVHQLELPAQYVRYLQKHPTELDALFRELLIGVTSFFRDPEAFEALATAMSELIAQRPQEHTLRVWVPGCSTGEEAYSIAILLRECMDRLKRHPSVQIFATDIDNEAINFARSGLYPESISADLSAERLERCFTHEDGAYRIRKDLREMLIFAPQNMIADPPFTKLDLVSCRNLLIYLDGRLQLRILPIFHYALRPGGVLFLGTSESVGTYTHLFRAFDKKAKLFVRKEVAAPGNLADFPATVPVDAPVSEVVPTSPIVRKRAEVSLSQLSDRVLLGALVPPSAIVHERGEIVHIHGRTGQFLEPAPGPQVTANIFDMAREGLQLELASAMRQAGRKDAEVIRRGVRVKDHAGHVTIDLRVRRLVEPEPFRGLYLVSFEPAHRAGADEARQRDGHRQNDRITELERELQYTKESHQSTVEELETANEELKSTNEELQSTNEELQSANEELETSKEEMQSLNEELATVNAELQGKLEELSRANDDMKNLLNGTDIATIFLDNDLNIKRFTDRARKVIKVIASDVGRPVADLVSQLRYPTLLEDAREVANTLVFKEVEVESVDGSWYLVRIVPYRTTGNVIDGLVLTFVEITSMKGMQETQQLIMRALESSATSVSAQDLELRYLWGLNSVLGSPAAEIAGKTDADLVGAALAAPIVQLKQRVLRQQQTLRERVTLTLRGRTLTKDLVIAPLRDAAQRLVGVTCIETEEGRE